MRRKEGRNVGRKWEEIRKGSLEKGGKSSVLRKLGGESSDGRSKNIIRQNSIVYQ